METAKKLRQLKKAVIRNRRFDLMSVDHCIVAVALRLRDDGTVSRTHLNDSWGKRVQAFAVKFSMSFQQAYYLGIGFLPDDMYTGDDRDFIKLPKNKNRKLAAELIEKYARLYDRLEDLPTSGRLRRLARAILENERSFDQINPVNCIVGFGNRLLNDGSLSYLCNYDYNNTTGRFSAKFGVTIDEADALYSAKFRNLNIGEPTIADSWHKLLPASKVVKIINKLANKYEAAGN